MIINVDNFSFVDENGLAVQLDITFDTVNDSFTVAQLVTNGNIAQTVLTEQQRGRAENSNILTQCVGFNNYNFVAIFRFPFVELNIDYRSTSCGYVQAPIPPPTSPTTCDLAVTGVATAQQNFNVNDGTIEATISQTLAGTVQINLYKLGTTTNPVRTVVLSSAQTEFIFENLAPDDYYLNAFDVNTNCLSPDFNITVDRVSFNEKYFFEFCEERFDKRDIRLSIKTKNFAGTPTNIEVAGAQVATIEYNNDNEDKFNQILGSNAQISFITFEEFQYQDLYLSEEKDNLLEIHVDGDLYWTGYLTADQVLEPFSNPPYPISLSALDGVKLLNDIPFDKVNGKMTFLEVIKFCLDKTELFLPFKTMVDFTNDLFTKNGILTGFEFSIFGNIFKIFTGTYKISDVEYSVTSTFTDFTIAPLTPGKVVDTYYIYANNNNILSISTDSRIPFDSCLVGVLTNTADSLSFDLEPYLNNDPVNCHKIQVNRFIKKNGEFDNCLNVLNYVCSQFSAQIKQVSGYWVFENLGAKARGNTTEFTYNNDLLLLSEDVIDLTKDLSCDNGENKILSGSNISLITGNKKSIVKWVLGFPAPIFNNADFSQWVLDGGKLIPIDWTLSLPYNWFERGTKFERVFDPNTNILTEVATNNYYFNIKYGALSNSLAYTLQSSKIVVFNQEVINFAFQLILTNRIDQTGTFILTFKFNIGNFTCANSVIGGQQAFEPVWVRDDGRHFFAIKVDFDPSKFNPFGDETNINLKLPPSPAQGFFNFTINIGNYVSDLGFDNFKVTKSNPLNDVSLIEESIITVENKKKYSNVPDEFEVIFGDVESDLRTDGIRTLNNTPTQNWKRIGENELESINGIIAKELLSQYQGNFRIFEGQLFGNDFNVRNIFNLPAYDLSKFIPLLFRIDLVKSISDVTLAELFVNDGLNSGPISGGSGPGSGNLIPNVDFALGWKGLTILSDGDNNIFKLI